MKPVGIFLIAPIHSPLTRTGHRGNLPPISS